MPLGCVYDPVSSEERCLHSRVDAERGRVRRTSTLMRRLKRKLPTVPSTAPMTLRLCRFQYSTFISSLGGALSLYLGIALILLVEVLELLVFLALDTVRFICGLHPAQREAARQHNVRPGKHYRAIL